MIAFFKLLLVLALIFGVGVSALTAMAAWPGDEAFLAIGVGFATIVSIGLALVIIAIFDKLDDITTLAEERNTLLRKANEQNGGRKA